MSSEENGFLTDVDKQFLRGEKEYESNQGRYDRRRAIAKRTRQAFHDFALLYEVLDEHERDRIFDPPRPDVPELFDAVRDTISFLYWAIEGEPGEKQPDRSFFYRFDQLFPPAIRSGEKRRYDEPVSVNYEPYNISHYQTEAGWLEQVADDLAKNAGDGVADNELRGAIATMAKYTTGEIQTSEHNIGGEPVDEWQGVTDLHDLADYVAKNAEEHDGDDE